MSAHKQLVIILGLGFCLLNGILSPVSAQEPSKVPAALWLEMTNKAETDFFVILSEQADLQGADLLQGKAKTHYVYDQLWQTAQASQASLKTFLAQNQTPYQSFYIINALLVTGNRDLLLQLANRSEVAYFETNPRLARLRLPPNPPVSLSTLFPPPHTIEPNLSYVNADEVWAQGYTGEGIVIGGQDTGYMWDHPALINQYRGSTGSGVIHDYNWHDSIHTTAHNSDCGVDSPVPCDDHGHGTHTMGIAVGDDGADNKIGMAPGAKWIGCRNMDEGYGTPATYLECFEFFLAPYPIGGTPAQGNPALAPDVTVNSWSCPPSEGCSWSTLQAAVEAHRAAGIMTVVSAGNAGNQCSTVSTPPSIYDAAYTIGALTNGTDTLASFSSRGPVTIDGSNRHKPDLVAPGTAIRSSYFNGNYVSLSGTSMAGPHVSGAVALLWSAVPTITHNIPLTEQYLNQNTFRIDSDGCNSQGWPNNLYGHGRLDIAATINAARVNLTSHAYLPVIWR